MSTEQILGMINARLDRLERKIDNLNESKWSLYGGIAVLVGILTIAFNFISSIVTKLIWKKKVWF